MKGEELAQKLMTCLAVDYNFGSSAIIGGMRDGTSVNGAVLRQLLFFYPKLFDVVCFSHTIDNVGDHFEFHILDSFAHYWKSMFAHSYNARLVWKERTGVSIRTFSDTRWWSQWENLQQVSDFFGDMNHFFERMLKFHQQIEGTFWRFLTIRIPTRSCVWSWLPLWMQGYILSRLHIF